MADRDALHQIYDSGNAWKPSFLPGADARLSGPATWSATPCTGLGGLPRERRVGARYDPYAQRSLGFLYLAAAGLNSNLNAT